MVAGTGIERSKPQQIVALPSGIGAQVTLQWLKISDCWNQMLTNELLQLAKLLEKKLDNRYFLLYIRAIRNKHLKSLPGGETVKSEGRR